MRTIAADIATQVIESGGCLRLQSGRLEIAGPIPQDLRHELEDHCADVIAWMIGTGRGQDAVGLARMAQARRSAGVELSQSDVAALAIITAMSTTNQQGDF